MKLAIMQPYLFPYVGYFNLASQVDKFVFYDDVSYIKNGWINRNRLIFSGEVKYFTIPLRGASSNLLINKVEMQPKSVWLRKILESIKQSYSKAPNFQQCYEFIVGVLDNDTVSISELAKHSVVSTSKLLGLGTNFIYTSSIYENAHLKGVERVIDICSKERADMYVNLPGGQNLYEEQIFRDFGIELKFIQPNLLQYQQFRGDFIPALSILDVLMFNDLETCKDLVNARH